MSFTMKVLASRGQPLERIYYIYITPAKQQKRYFFILVDPPKEPAFLKAIKSDGGYDLRDFGKIIASGYGDAPKQLKDEIASRYKIVYND